MADRPGRVGCGWKKPGGSKPFRLVLPDLGGLYEHIDAYSDRHRRVLLGSAEDPGTFFIKTVKATSKEAHTSRRCRLRMLPLSLDACRGGCRIRHQPLDYARLMLMAWPPQSKDANRHPAAHILISVTI
ncbi:hypothetical protein NKJ26_29270 [Mesorhizobium sp. M0152]|uniref:hypothetical protein n=1 Tax=Mesorhizobium sp. M0152 TaxID=2956898 RepID=UPI0033369C6A